MSEITAEVSGVVSIDGQPAERPVLIIADDQINGRRVLAEVISNPDGSFATTYTGWTGSIIALAMDHYGDEWRAGRAMSLGDTVHPTTANGYVYKCTTAGITGDLEPSWSLDGSGVNDGSATYTPSPYFRPIASGPIQGNVIPVIELTYYDDYALSLAPTVALSLDDLLDPVGSFDLSEVNATSQVDGLYLESPTARKFKVGDYLYSPTSPAFAGARSISVWVKSPGGIQYENIWATVNNNDDRVGLYLHWNSTASSPVRLVAGTDAISLEADIAIDDDAPHHVVVTDDGVNTVMWVDGVMQSTVYEGSLLSLGSGGTLMLGSYFYSGDMNANFTGVIDGFYLFDAVLGEKQVQDLYTAGTVGLEQKTYPQVVIESSPVSYWRLEEVSGTAAVDEMGYSSGFYVSAPDLDQAPVITTGKSIKLNELGVSEQQHILFGSSWPFDTWTGLTFECWVVWSGNSGNDPRLISRNNGGSRMRWVGEHTLEFQLAGVKTVSVSYAFPANQVVHMVCTWDGTTASIYENGTLLKSETATGSLTDNGQNLYFGWEDSGIADADRWQGRVDEIAVYDRGLTPEEIQQHYQSGTASPVV